ncbi:MAG: hypothetical protein JO336_12980 [Acidobacteriia bacterium]|nr:hypothetical protein [Terriglobia bacterium]MBV8904670.1 hypothetical protein [Terriglobia bacterium]
MKLTHFTRSTACGAPAGLTLLAVSLIVGAIPAEAEERETGQLHIVKDCGPTVSPGTPGSAYCRIVTSSLPELPAGTLIYYDQITAGPTAGTAGFLDSNVFVYISESHWAVGRCTVPNDNKPGLCTLSDGVGSLAGFSARIVVTYAGGSPYAWDGTYSFKLLPER